MTADGRAALASAVRRSLPRLLSLIDRASFSPTRGAADRAFWHYRVDKDYASATFAQAAWPLALLAVRDPAGLDDGLRARLAELSLAAMAWWAEIQHEDGSFDEWFPFERSHVATAFTTFGVAEAARILGDRFQTWERRGRVLDAIARAARWLSDHVDTEVSNHLAGAVAALASVETLLPGTARPELDRQIATLVALQTDEGWFPEYGGADPGYGTVSLAFLAQAARTNAPALDPAIERLADHLLPFVNPDGSFGGEHGRRATRYAWLTGPALLGERLPAARALGARLGTGLAAGTLPAPEVFDDRYFCFFAFPDAVAALDGMAAAPPSTDAGSLVESVLPRAGLVVRHGDLHVVAGMGTVKVYGGPLLYDDCGLAGVLDDGRLVATWGAAPPALATRDRVVWERPFAFWSRESPISRHPVSFRVFNRTLGRIPGASAAVAARAKARYTSTASAAPIALSRQLDLTGRSIVLRDTIRSERPLAALSRVSSFAPLHVPSAPLWLPAFEPRLAPSGPDLATLAAAGRDLSVTTTVEIEGGDVVLRVEAGGKLLQHDRCAM